MKVNRRKYAFRTDVHVELFTKLQVIALVESELRKKRITATEIVREIVTNFVHSYQAKREVIDKIDKRTVAKLNSKLSKSKSK